MKELTFLVHEAEEGGYYAEAAGIGIFCKGRHCGRFEKKHQKWY